jgi:Mg-chelatase subunit ChlD
MSECKGESRENLIFLIDCSGSMETSNGINGKEDLVDGINIALEKLGSAVAQVQICGFNNVCFEIIQTCNLTRASPRIKAEEFEFVGDTKLFDVLGAAIEALAYLTPPDDPTKVTFVIATDGDDTSSKVHTAATISALVKEHRAKGVRFIFIGAGDDAMKAGRDMGICTDNEVYRVKQDQGENIGSSFTSEHVLTLMSQSLGVDCPSPVANKKAKCIGDNEICSQEF